jgi:murein DD-endopeptidase MepM/ murein hydrolase activator NlpD
MKNIDFKKILIVAVGLILLFLPTYVAIASYNNQKPVDNFPVISTMTIADPDGRTSTITSNNDENGIFEMFSNINSGGTLISSLPDSLSGSSFLLVTYSTPESDISYKYYFTTNSSECYYADPSGKIYKIAVNDAKSFLGSTYSVYLYKTATPPVLTASGTNTISASTMNWYYLVSGGTYQQYDYTVSTNSDLTYDVGNNFTFNFSIAPSDSNLKVYNSDELLYDGGINDLHNLNLSRNTSLKFVITASWAQSNECEYYGNAEYEFNALVLAPAEFKIGESSIEHGDIVVISGINVTSPDEISVSFEPALANNFVPKFYKDGDLVHALVPFSYDVSNGEYQITVTYGITTQTFSLKVGESRYGFNKAATKYSASEALIATFYSEDDISAYNSIRSDIFKNSEELKYFSGAFINYETPGTLTAKKSTIKLGFTRESILKDGRTFKHTGIDFETAAGIDVPSMSSGKVVYTGFCDVLGNFVVVDHGFGLKTWYAHLSEISVTVGDVVKTSQSLGKTGNSGFIIDNRLHIEFTLFDIPVAPFSIWDEGIIVPDFN